jgi:hypothetical protein
MPVPTNNLTFKKGEDFNPHFIVGKKIKTSSVANPSVIETETAHGFANGDTVYIVGHINSTPSIDTQVGYRITVIDDTHFSIPVNVTTGGQFGIVSNIVGDISGQTIQGFVKSADTQSSPFITVNGAVVGGQPSLTFKLPFTSANTQSTLVGTIYKYEGRRTDSGSNTVLTEGNFTPETERQFQTP